MKDDDRKRRKLDSHASKQEQFEVLRSTGLSCVDSRKVIQCLQDGESGQFTCQRPHLAYAKAFPCYEHLAPTGADGSAVRIPIMKLPDLLQAKINACPLYSGMLREAMAAHQDRLTLLFYCDEVSGGNVLSALQSRKSKSVLRVLAAMSAIVPREHVANIECCQVFLHSKRATWDG